MQPSLVTGDQGFQFEPGEEVQNGVFPVKSASADELRQVCGAGSVHRIHHTAHHLDPIDHLRPLERALVLAEFDRLVRRRDQRTEIVREAPIRMTPAAGIEPHQRALRLTALDHRDGVPRVLTLEHGRRTFGVAIVDPVGGMQAVELVLEHGRQHAEMLERLQGEATLPVPDVDVEATGFVHKDVEVRRQQLDRALHPPQRPGTEAERRGFDLDVALEVSVVAGSVVDVDGCVVCDCPTLVVSAGGHGVGTEARFPEAVGDVAAADHPQLTIAVQFSICPKCAFGKRNSWFVIRRINDDDAFDFDAEGEVQWIRHASRLVGGYVVGFEACRRRLI